VPVKKKDETMKLIRNQDGMAMVVVVLLLSATSVIALASVLFGSMDTRLSGNYRDGITAIFSSEGGIHAALRELRQDTTWSAGFSNVALSNGAEYTVTINQIDSTKAVVRSVGKYRLAEREIEVLVNLDSPFGHAINVGGDLTLVGKPRIGTEGVRANGHVHLDMANGSPALNVYLPDTTDVTLIGDTDQVNLLQTPAMDLDAIRLSTTEWQTLASAAPPAYYFDADATFNTLDSDTILSNFDCSSVPADAGGKRTVFVDGNVTFTGELSGECTIVATGKIIGQSGFYMNGSTVSLIAMDDVLLNFDTNTQSTADGLIYTEANYELHGKVKFTGVVTAHGDVTIQNPSEFTNNYDANYWYTYSAAYNVLLNPVNVTSWRERHPS
jgi:hypothetical protein